MRLTLRTLLAYLNGILDPGDAEDLGKKIEQSEYAVTLVHRIHDVMRRLRLGVPSLTDRGPGLDPNTVAEYLDNSLPSERVTDFEKVCLDSDIHLAEVASGYQILTLVLGEPAEVDPESRQRMYNLKETAAPSKPTPPAMPARVVQGPTPPPVLDLEPPDHPPTVRRSRPKPTVPDYLREPRRRSAWSSLTAMLLAAACLLVAVVVVLKLLGQLEQGSPLGDWLISMRILATPPATSEVAKAGPTPAKGATPANESGEPGAESTKAPAAEAGNVPAGTSAPAARASTETPAAPAGQPGKQSSSQPAPSVAPLPVERTDGKAPATAPGPSGPAPGARSQGPESPNARPSLPPDRSAAPGVGSDSNAVRPDEPAGSGTTPGKSAPPSANPPPPPPPSTDASKPSDAAKTVLPPEPMGRLMSNEQVLLSDRSAGEWTRVAANQMLVPQQVLALPTYRAKIAMTAGVMVEILGGSRVELLGTSPTELPGIRLLYGRVVLMPLAKAGAALRLAFGDHVGTITFVDTDSVVALDVRRIRTPGANPEGNSAVVTADLYVPAGDVLWEPAGVAKGQQKLAPSDHLSFQGKLVVPPTQAKELPPWITAEPIGQLDRRASGAISQSLPTDRPARLGLLELTTRPQKEVKWLSLRCLGYVGYFHDLIAALNDPAHKLDWQDYIDELRAAVARDAETAAAVRLALENQYPQQAAVLYRMLWGYTDDDLRNGDDANLVKALDDDSLAVRVLAIWNLKDVTGLVGQYYRPEETPARRQQPTRRWKQRLEAKEIRLKGPEEEKAGPPARGRPASSPRRPPPPPANEAE